jgi:hypothetical protein
MNRMLSPPILISLMLILSFGLFGFQLVRSAPEAVTPKYIEIKSAETEAVLGKKELAQRPGPRSPETRHLSVRHTNKGWNIANIARYKKIEVRTDTHPVLFLKRWQLNQGDTLFIGEHSILVQGANQNALVLSDIRDSREVIWQNRELNPSGELVYKDHLSLRQKIGSRVRQWFGDDTDKEIFLFSIGGSVNCPDRWKLENIPSQALRVLRYRGNYWLAPGQGNMPVRMARKGEKPVSFGQLRLPLSGESGNVNRLIIGRTYYKIKFDSDTLRLIPISGQDVWFGSEELPQPSNPNISVIYDSIRWIGAGISIWDWLKKHWLKLMLIIFAGGAAAHIIREHHPSRGRRSPASPLNKKFGAFIPAIVFVPLTLLMWRERGTADLSMLLFMAWLGKPVSGMEYRHF